MERALERARMYREAGAADPPRPPRGHVSWMVRDLVALTAIGNSRNGRAIPRCPVALARARIKLAPWQTTMITNDWIRRLVADVAPLRASRDFRFLFGSARRGQRTLRSASRSSAASDE
jgi:hypothetical protein